MPKLVFFDLDGTLINNPSSENLYILWLLGKGYLGLSQLVSYVKFVSRWSRKFKTEVFVKNKAYLDKLPLRTTIQQAGEFTRAILLPRLRPKLVVSLKQHQNAGEIVVLLTGAPRFIAEVFAEHLGITEVCATELAISRDCFTALPPLQHPFAFDKVVVAQRLCSMYGVELSDSTAYANSIHDLALLSAVSQAIAVTPDNKLRMIARQKNWQIIN